MMFNTLERRQNDEFLLYPHS